MTGQMLLFSRPSAQSKPVRPDASKPLSHRTDPDTSREAAERLRTSGKLTGQRKAVLEALHECDGSTHGELGAFMGVHWLTPARRLPELARVGLARRGEPRVCRVKGSKCTSWWVADQGVR